jgi:DNA-binding NarL/FixJ family response regulator
MGIRVFHCDDSDAFTRLVAFWLAEHPDIEHVGEARTAQAAVAALPAARPDVILLDTMGLPGDGRLLSSIRGAAPGARVIVYSGYVRLLREEALGERADAYLAKSDDDAALVALIREVAAR